MAKKPNLTLSSAFVTEIVGMRYQFKTDRSYEQEFFRLLEGVEVIVKHEKNNKKDKNACAVFLKRKRIGYLPSFVAKKVAQKMKRGSRFRFFVFDLAHRYHEYQGLPTTSLLGIEEK